MYLSTFNADYLATGRNFSRFKFATFILLYIDFIFHKFIYLLFITKKMLKNIELFIITDIFSMLVCILHLKKTKL